MAPRVEQFIALVSEHPEFEGFLAYLADRDDFPHSEFTIVLEAVATYLGEQHGVAQVDA